MKRSYIFSALGGMLGALVGSVVLDSLPTREEAFDEGVKIGREMQVCMQKRPPKPPAGVDTQDADIQRIKRYQEWEICMKPYNEGLNKY